MSKENRKRLKRKPGKVRRKPKPKAGIRIAKLKNDFLKEGD